MNRNLRCTPFLLILAATMWLPSAYAARYDSLLERGQFYLSRGNTYGADAVRTLEAARDADPRRGRSDAALQSALAHAYVLTARHSEAFWLLQDLEENAGLGPMEQRLREQLVSESGLGRVRLRSVVRVDGLTARLEASGETRLDVTGRKILERLNELLARGISPDAEGITLLAPEGEYRFSCDPTTLYAPREPIDVEVWAGDEVTVRLVPRYPRAGEWSVTAKSRSLALAWPPLSNATYRLYRLEPGGEVEVYAGDSPSYTDSGLGVGSTVEHRLEVRDARGELVAASTVRSQTLPPVAQIAVEAHLGGDLTMGVAWALGYGAADRVRLVRESEAGEETVAEVAAERRGAWVDGPFLPEDTAQEIAYRAEAWIDGEGHAAAVATAVVEIPPRVMRVSAVEESVERGVMVVGWETLPRDGLAEGYAVYRQRNAGTLGELVGRVHDPAAREFEYPIDNALDATDWRHFVVPYLGNRLLFDPDWLQLDATVPEKGFDKRVRSGVLPPDLGLSWDPYPGTRTYLVVVGEREDLVDKPYVEINGLQNNLAPSEYPVEVFAVQRNGTKVPLLKLRVEYLHYPRSSEDLAP